jgi:hypothetical protein
MGGPQQAHPEDQQQPTAGGNFYPTGQILGTAAQGQYNQSTNDFGPSK